MLFSSEKENILNHIDKEWLLTYGNGSYTLNNLFLIQSRRYHSLFSFAKRPPTDRHSIFNSFDETINIDGVFYNLFSVRTDKDKIFPEGHLYIKEISIKADCIIWIYDINDLILEKRLSTNKKENSLDIRYRIKKIPKDFKNISIYFRPFLEDRKSENIDFSPGDFFKIHKKLINDNFQLSSQPDCEFIEETYTKDIFLKKEDDYKMEKCRLKVSSPGYFRFELKDRKEIIFHFSEIIEKNRFEIKSKHISDDPLINSLYDHSLSFITKKDKQYFIMAGYPWFGPWGRDTFISLPGLAILTQHTDIAENIIDSFARLEKNGIIPNTIQENTEHLYNTVDASLWMINSIYQLYKNTNKDEIIKKYFSIINRIIFEYRKGTINNIHMDKSDSLIYAGKKNTQLTWMDAKNQGKAFTPRWGKAVEINALWYNALCILRLFSEKLGLNDNINNLNSLIDRVKRSFIINFWNEEKGYLYDFINEERKDDSLRPNMLYAVSLPFPVIDYTIKVKKVFEASKKLFNKYALRSLSKNHKDYKGEYKGDWFQRDSTYHQGTAWPFLLGVYLEAWIKSEENSSEVKEQVRDFITRYLDENMKIMGIGFIPELFNGDAPYIPHGTPMQAWSSAEILRIYLMYLT